MATRWMKWNEGTHIFEYSTDGVTFNPLPLDASILTQGVIDPARLPPTVPNLGQNNIFTGIPAMSLISANPLIRWSETTQAVGSKNWDTAIGGAGFYLRTYDDAWATPNNILQITRGGTFVWTPSVAGDNSIISAAAGRVALNLRVTNPGAGTYAHFGLGTDLSPYTGVIQAFSSTYTASAEPDFQNGLSIKAALAGGMSLICQQATAGIRFYTGGSAVKRLEITSAGNLVASGTLTTKGRAVADGVWTTVPHSAANFTASTGTWTVDAADQIHLRYTYLSGNSMLVSFDIRASSVSAITSYLYLRVPDGKASLGSTNGGGSGSNNGAVVPLGVFGLSGSVIYITPGPVGVTWAASVNNTSVNGSVILDVN